MTLQAQNVNSFPLVAEAFYGVDDFNAVYYATNDVLYKSQDGVRQQFYDVLLGELSSVDIINPLKVLLFYKETQTVVLLDNRFNELERVSLDKLQPYRYINDVRLAGERRLWLHNLDLNTIELYNYVEGRTLVQSSTLTDSVELLLTDYNFCHVATKSGVTTLNTYGSSTGSMPLDYDHLSYDFEQLAAMDKNSLSLYGFGKELRFRESGNSQKPLPQKPIEAIYLKAGILYIWDGKIVTRIPLAPLKN